MTKVQECLAKNIKRYRKALHLTQEQLAERAETSTNYIGTIEIGQKFPSPQMIERIARALQVDSLQLFQSDEKFTAPQPPQVDVAALKKSLMKNLKSAVDDSIAEVDAFG